jgi:hypothetical protein
MKVAIKPILVLSAVLAAMLWLVTVYLIVGFLEDYEISDRSPVKYLVIHKALRGVQAAGQCSPRVYSRYFQECGGICGEQQDLAFGTTASLEEVKAAVDPERLEARMGVDEVQVRFESPRPGANPECPVVLVRTHDDYRLD